MSIIDLSAPIAPSPENIPPFLKTEIQYNDHTVGADQIQALTQVPPNLLRNGEGWATETITRLGTHDSTHVDAPYHYNSQIQGQPSQTIDQLPLEWFFSDGVKLDMSHKADGDAVTVADIEADLTRTGITLKPLDIVLVQNNCDQYYNQMDYTAHGCGVTAEATKWLFTQGIRVMGIDAWGWDVPLHLQAQEAIAKQEPGIFWAAHQVDLPYAQIERLMNLRELPPSGFKVSCFPLKIIGGSAGPARVVAIID
jgi:kynurenine formamidase